LKPLQYKILRQTRLDHRIHHQHIPFLQARRAAKGDLPAIMAAKLNVADLRPHEVANHRTGDAPHQISGKNERAIKHHHDIEGPVAIISRYRSS
jgi:hypothetical protein